MNYIITGKVVRGDGYGKKLGFPTINLETQDRLPAAGVYAGKAELEGKVYQAGILINPTGKVEAHLISFKGDAYGKVVTLEIKKFLRKFKKFKTEEGLIRQIEKDLQKCSRE